MKKYSIRNTISHIVLEYADSIDEAKDIITYYEQDDINNKMYTEGFYEIYDNELKITI